MLLFDLIIKRYYFFCVFCENFTKVNAVFCDYLILQMACGLIFFRITTVIPLCRHEFMNKVNERILENIKKKNTNLMFVILLFEIGADF